MKLVNGSLSPAALIAVCLISVSPVRADDKDNQLNRYVITKLTSDIQGLAQNTNSVLQNAWGVAFTPGASPFWISDNATGCSTLYDGEGVPQPQPPPVGTLPLKVKIPLPGTQGAPATDCQHFTPPPPNAINPPPTPAAPTGVVWNPSSTFLVPNTGKSATLSSTPRTERYRRGPAV